MAKYTHQHPFTNLRLALSFVALYGVPMAVIRILAISPSLPFNVTAAVLFLLDFVLSLVDILATSQPRHLDALFDGIVGVGYIVIWILSVVYEALRSRRSTSYALGDEVLIACALHIFACIKNANPRNRVHWARDVSFPAWTSPCKGSHSSESA